jgi:hypothetical protein
MIYAFNFTCARDLELSILMLNTFTKHCPEGSISITNTDVTEPYKGYGNGAGWPQSMMKLKALSDVVKTKNVQDNDFILSVDSDVVFTSPEVFKYVDPAYGIIGIKHHPEFNTLWGKWSHMSGALIFIRGYIAKKMIALNEDELHAIRFKHFKGFNLTENEDVVLSYLASYVGAEQMDLGPLGLTSGDFESDVAQYHRTSLPELWFAGEDDTNYRIPMKSFYHLNYCPTQFLGEPVSGKWMIPSILRMKGIEL